MELSVKRSSLVFLLLLTLLSPSTLSARVLTPQQRSTKPTTTAAPATAAAPARLPEANLISKMLPNGLEIIVLEDHSVPLVTIELAVRNGSYTEPPELNGLSHLYEHMFFRANATYPQSGATLDRASELGAIVQVTNSTAIKAGAARRAPREVLLPPAHFRGTRAASPTMNGDRLASWTSCVTS